MEILNMLSSGLQAHLSCCHLSGRSLDLLQLRDDGKLHLFLRCGCSGITTCTCDTTLMLSGLAVTAAASVKEVP